MKLLRLFPKLHVKDGYTLHGCRYFAYGNGNGIVRATKKDNLHSDLLPTPTSDSPMVPTSPEAFENVEGTLPDFMDSIEGDGTPWSYYSASILARELAEYGALWHGASWSTHTLLDAPPWKSTHSHDDERHLDSLSSENDWTWEQEAPVDWRPQVEFVTAQPRVTFYTFSAMGGERMITKFVDKYASDTYGFESEETEVAHGPGGYVF